MRLRYISTMRPEFSRAIFNKQQERRIFLIRMVADFSLKCRFDRFKRLVQILQSSLAGSITQNVQHRYKHYKLQVAFEGRDCHLNNRKFCFQMARQPQCSLVGISIAKDFLLYKKRCLTIPLASFAATRTNAIASRTDLFKLGSFRLTRRNTCMFSSDGPGSTLPGFCVVFRCLPRHKKRKKINIKFAPL